MFPEGWARRTLEQIVTQKNDWVRVTPDAEYRLLGVRVRGVGAYDRGTITGAKTKYPKFNVAEAGDLVLSKIWARNGAIAVIDSTTSGCSASPEFPLFSPHQNEVLSSWLRLYMSLPQAWEDCERLAKGTSGQNRITPAQFLRMEIPLPPIAEQLCIVAVLEQADRAVDAAARHAADAEVLLRATVQSEILPAAVDWDAATISDLVTPALRQEKVDNSRVYRMAGVRLYGNGPYLRETKIGSEIKATRLFRLAEGDFIYNKLFAGEGAFGLVGPELADAHVSNEFPVFICGPEAVDAKFLRYHFSLPDVIDGVRLACVGTTASRSRWHERKFLSYQLPLPPLAEQKAIVARIEKVEAAVRAAETHLARLRALRSSLLENLVSGRVRLPATQPAGEAV